MKTKEQKQVALDSLSKSLPESSITIFTSFARANEPGLTVDEMQELKAALRAAEAQYVVAKKRLVEKALSGLKYEGIDVFGIEGSMGLVIGSGEGYATAKALYQFSKAHPSLKLFSGWMGGVMLTPEQVMEMATMPGRDELLARLLGMLNYPLTSLAIVLNQIAEQKDSGAETPAAEVSTGEVPSEESTPTAEAPAEEEKTEEKPAEEEVTAE